jgi:two-component system sensor histidine kinase BaeS
MSGLRGRVFLALGATALLATVLTVLVATYVLHKQAEQRREQALAKLADTAAEPLAASLPGTATKVVLTGTAKGTRRLRPARADQVLRQVHRASGKLRFHGREVNYVARDTDAGRIVLLGATGAASHNGPPPGRTLLLAGLGGLLLALLASIPLARRLTRPLDELSQGAGKIAKGQTGVQVQVKTDDELGRLGIAFNTMSTELERARDAERAFLVAISHELKTPLSAVRGYAEGIDDGAIEPAHGAAVIAEEAARIERLVADLLDLARMRATAFKVRTEPFDLAEVAREAVERHAPRARAAGIDLREETTGEAGEARESRGAGEARGASGTETRETLAAGGTRETLAAGGTRETLATGEARESRGAGETRGAGSDATAAAPGFGDPERTLQAVSNLVENALRVVPRGGSIVVAAAPGRIEVRDDGPGIAAEDVPRAFERSFLHARGRRPGTAGLGLALVRELATAMGGDVRLESAPGRTVFTLALR